MGMLLSLILIAGLFFLMMRFGFGARVMGHARWRQDSASLIPTDTTVDPVCGMSVTTARSKSALYRGRAYYFCTAEHREAFEAEPDRYLGSQEHHLVLPDTVLCATCGMSVSTAWAKSALYRDRAYYFCTDKCRDAFEAEPDRYIGPNAGSDSKTTEHSRG
jgi:YHS domain-containing protein